MKITLTTLFILSSICGWAEDSFILGNQAVQAPEGTGDGNFANDGSVRLSQVPVSLGEDFLAANSLDTALYYGPMTFGRRSTKIEYLFEKRGDHDTGDFVNIPLGRFACSGNVKLSFQVESRDPNNPDSDIYRPVEFAEFMIAGPRHSSGSSHVFAFQHSAFGEGEDIKLKAFFTHSYIYLMFDFDYSYFSNAERTHRISVAVETASYTNVRADDPFVRENSNVGVRPGAKASLEKYHPVVLLDSHVARRLNRTYHGFWLGGDLGLSSTFRQINAANLQLNSSKIELGGEISILEPQGDISMGIFGPAGN